MYKVSITEKAAADLDGIISYIALKLANPAAATDFAEEVSKCYDGLRHMPYMYEKCRDKRLLDMGYRKAVIKNYIMIYRVAEAEQAVYVMRFFYGARDYEKLI